VGGGVGVREGDGEGLLVGVTVTGTDVGVVEGVTDGLFVG